MALLPDSSGINDVAKAIQLALAPAFLMTATAGMLNVMTGRLARIVDRARSLIKDRTAADAADREAARSELEGLALRRHFAGAAITACTLAALLICTVIAALFAEVILDAHLAWLIGALFTAATLSLIVGLAYFLREVHLATRLNNIRFRDCQSPKPSNLDPR